MNCISDSAYNCVGGKPSSLPCPCLNPALIYNMTMLVCTINCGLIPYTNGLANGVHNQCNCVFGFTWDYATKSCRALCGIIPKSSALVAGTINQCTCVAPYAWYSDLNKCVVNCTALANSVASDFARTINSCICRSSFVFDTAHASPHTLGTHPPKNAP